MPSSRFLKLNALLLTTTVVVLGITGWFYWTAVPSRQDDMANRLYQRRILSAAGRQELRRRLRAHTLVVREYDQVTQTTTEQPSTSAAAILAFCAEAFDAEFTYRTLDTGAITPPLDSVGADATRLAAALTPYEQARQQFGEDTLAFQRWYVAQLPARLRLEEAIPAEDSLPHTHQGWTIYPPLRRPTLTHWIHAQRSVFGKTRTRTARDLYALGLIEQPVYALLLEQLQQGQLQTEEQVCQQAAELTMHRARYANNKAKQLRWLTRLQQAGLLRAAQYQHLLHSYRPYELKDPFDVVAYCEHSTIIDLRQLSPDPRAVYSALFARLPALLPAFRYTDLRVILTEEDELSEVVTQKVTLRFRANGREYEDTFLQGYRRQDGTEPNPQRGAQVSDQFHRVVNRWLADQHSALRLHQVHKPDAQSVYGQEQLGLVALTQLQRPLWGPNGYFVSSESYDTRFTSAAIEKMINWYQHLGLFSHLSAAEVAQGRRSALRGQKTSYAAVLLSFPNTLCVLDWESAIAPAPYAAHTRQLAAISRGGFTPTRVQDSFATALSGQASFSFGFHLQGQAYRTSLRVQSDWLDARFMDLIGRALKEQHSRGKFYACLDGEGYLFLTPAQYAVLQGQQSELFTQPADVGTDE